MSSTTYYKYILDDSGGNGHQASVPLSRGKNSLRMTTKPDFHVHNITISLQAHFLALFALNVLIPWSLPRPGLCLLSPPPVCHPNSTTLPTPGTFLRQYIYQVLHSHFRRLPQSTDHSGKRTGAVVKRLWVEGQRRGISATEMPGFDSRSAKQNFPQELQEDFRTQPPPFDRRMGLVGELFVCNSETYPRQPGRILPLPVRQGNVSKQV